MRQCRTCKDGNQFSPSELAKTNGRCKRCVSDSHKKWREENHEKHLAAAREWNKNNTARYAANKKKWKKKHPKKVLESNNRHYVKRYHNDPVFRIRRLVSKATYQMLRLRGASKKRQSSSKFLPWKPEELWNHLLGRMKQPGNEWMTPDNQGDYNPKTWNDNDPTTWTWQLDHIIPQSDLPYDTMDHPNFKKCWALENLRPLSAKQNLMDGIHRTRHEKNGSL